MKSVKVDELKEFLAARNMPINGKKDFLVGMIEEYLENLNLN